MNLSQYFLLLAALLLSGCQASYIVKPDSFPQAIEKSRTLRLKMGDTSYQLADIYSEHRGLVMIFWQTSCPCVKRYQARVNDLFERYSREGLAFVHVSSNQNESFTEVQAEYNRRKILLPLMRDESGAIAKALGVKGTPTAALISQSGKLEFLGWIDNERDVNESGRQAYLEDAIKQMLANIPVSIQTSPMFGCSI